MSLFDKEERLLLPEWSKSKGALKTFELKSLKSESKYLLLDNTDFIYAEFNAEKKLGSAIELLNTAFIENREAEARIAAKYIVQGHDLPPQILNLARKVLAGQNSIIENITEDNGILITSIRAWLKDNPRDALSWVDLARAYISIGKIESAEKSMVVALSLLPNHRWLVRVASRFFVNLHQNDKAHNLLLKHPDLKNDPWLLSAEIAVAESYGRPRKNLNQAKSLILNTSIDLSHLTELESSLATIELSDGAVKKAKKLFVSSLRKPNDNSLAQAKWAERNTTITKLVSRDVLANHSGAYEAKLWEEYYNYNIKGAIQYGLKWFEDEPYTVQPAIMITYLAAILDDYSLCLSVCKKGLSIDKNDETLILNKMFAEACMLPRDAYRYNINEIDAMIISAKNFISNESDDYVAHSYANLGLVYYKLGDFERGREYYDMAYESYFKKKNSSYIVSLFNHYRESVLAGCLWSEEYFEKMNVEIHLFGIRKEPAITYYYLKMLKLRAQPTKWDEIKNEDIIIQPSKEDDKEVKKIVTFDFDPNNPTIWVNKK